MRTELKTALLCAAACFTALPAFAEDELVVTATRAPTEANRLPLRIDVIDRDDIEARGLSTLVDAIGSNAVQSGGAGQQSSVFLRGANSKHALALFDGIRLNDAAGPNAAYDFGQDMLGGLERVEILRGPASTIYGSDAIGGVVNLIPRRGGNGAFEPFLDVSGGSFNTLHGLFGASGSVTDWDYGASIEVLDTAGFDQVPDRFVTHTGDDDGARIGTFTASVRRDAGVFAFDALARFRHAEAEYDTLSGGPGFDLRADDPDLGNESDQTLWRFGAEMEASSELNFRLSGGQVLSERSETDGGFQTNAADSTRSFADLTAHHEWQRANLTGGLSFERNDIDTQPQFANPLSIAEDQSAAYLIGQVDLTARIVATGSARVDDYESFGTHSTYSLGAVADFAPLRLYASYATAFKAPSLSERYEESFFNIGNPDLEPEEAEIWEVGADWDAASAVRVGASYFQSRIDNLIEYRFALLRNINVGEAEIDGAEAYVEVAPANWFNARLSYAWTDARDAILDQQLARRPEDAWTLSAQITPTDHLALNLSWRYVGERTDVTYADDGTFISSTGTADDYIIGALNVTYDLDERAELFVHVDSVADEVYEPVNAYAGAPRSAFVGVRARY
jgi:vitamin B12 transporter